MSLSKPPTTSGDNEKISSIKFSYKWEIENFSYFYYLQDRGLIPITWIQSGSFSLTKNNDLQFFLRIYPFGFDLENKDYISITLHCWSKNSDLADTCYLRYKIFNLDWGDQECNVKENGSLLSAKDELTVKRFIEIEKATTSRYGYLPGDKLIIKCQIEITGIEIDKNILNEMPEFLSTSNAKIKITQLSRQWVIKEFGYFLYHNPIGLASSNFYEKTSNGEQYKLYFRLWPKGQDHQQDHLSLCLHLRASELQNQSYSGTATFELLKTQYHISILDDQNEKRHTAVDQRDLSHNNEFKCNRYICWAALSEQETCQLMPDGNLTIYCEIFVIRTNSPATPTSPNNTNNVYHKIVNINCQGSRFTNSTATLGASSETGNVNVAQNATSNANSLF